MSDEPFPRGSGLPKQSPLFWVQQKDRYLRQLLIGDIEKLTGRRLIVYFTDIFSQSIPEINHGDLAFLNEVVADAKDSPFDLMLETPGGVTDATEAIVSLLQATSSDVRVVVPHWAKSNGTTICLAAQEILMGAASELGPIDPHLSGTPTSILLQPEVKQQNFALHMLAWYAVEQTKALATRLLKNGMMKGKADADIDATVQALATKDKFFSHGSTIDHLEATALGLNVRYLAHDDELWCKLWLLHCMYSHDCTKSGAVKIFESRTKSAAIVPKN